MHYLGNVTALLVGRVAEAHIIQPQLVQKQQRSLDQKNRAASSWDVALVAPA